MQVFDAAADPAASPHADEQTTKQTNKFAGPTTVGPGRVRSWAYCMLHSTYYIGTPEFWILGFMCPGVGLPSPTPLYNGLAHIRNP